MYLANPILLMGIFGLCLALLLLPWRTGAKTEAMRKSANGVLTTLVVLGITWTLVGTVMGLNHMNVRPDCLKQEEVWTEKRAVAFDEAALEARKSPEQKAAQAAALTPAQKAEQEAEKVAGQEAEKEFMARCNTIIVLYSETTH